MVIGFSFVVGDSTLASRHRPGHRAPHLRSARKDLRSGCPLGDALTRAWRRLSAPARELTTILAVGGRPWSSGALATVARSVRFSTPVVPSLRAAVDGGVLLADTDDRYWFAHPLLAEVLVDGPSSPR